MRTIRIPYPELDKEALDRLLARDVSATLAFVDKDGFPRMVPCWFLWRDGAFHVSSLVDKYHVRCLRANPRASICVEHEEIDVGHRRTNRQAKAVGIIEFCDRDVEEWTRTIREKYLTVTGLCEPVAASREGAPVAARSDRPASEARVILRLRPRKLTAHGGSIERV
ncbi:MAG: pyridoxamine 5'-phosphate oxidase family protein [Gammaproteobacteria bacterium]|nr:pyridoxamine 5'-phosphate oxidase family protein [Gammaproteobacteria bacterium]